MSDEGTGNASPGGLRVLGIVTAVALLAGLSWFAAGHLDEVEAWQALRGANPIAVFGLMAVLLGVMLTNGLALRDLVRHFGVRLDRREWMGITFVASMLSLLAPLSSAGAMRAAYLRRVHGLPYAALGSVLAATAIVSLTVCSLVAAGFLLLLDVPGPAAKGLLATSAGIVLAALAAVLVPVASQRWWPRWLATAEDPVAGALPGWRRFLRELAQAWRSIGRDRRLLLRLLGWALAGAGLHAVAFVIAFDMVGFPGHWLVAATSSAFARIGGIVAFTPAGLGVVEAFGLVSAQVVGAHPGAAFLALVIVRLCASIVCIAAGLCFSSLVAHFTLHPPKGNEPQPTALKGSDESQRVSSSSDAPGNLP